MPLKKFLRRFSAQHNDSHDIPIVSKWTHLDQLDPQSREYSRLLDSVLDNKVNRKATTSLEGEDAILVLEILAKILERDQNLTNLSNHALRVLRKLAHHAGQVPNCYKINQSVGFDMEPVAFAGGGYSDVLKGTLGGELVAVKVLRMAQNTDVVELHKNFCKETVLWKNVCHPNILGLIAVDIDSSTGRCLMVSEFMEKGNIFSFIQDNWTNRLRLLVDVATGLSYLHHRKIFHGDIKGPNILITNATPPRACLCDFGFSVPAPTDSFPISACGMNLGWGTPPYTAPELIYPERFGLDTSEVSREADIFAFGMTIYEVVTGVRPFGVESKRVVELMFAVVEGKRPEKPANADSIGFGNGIWDLVEKCWSEKREQRPSTWDVRMRLAVAASMTSLAPPGSRLAQRIVTRPTIPNPNPKAFDYANGKGAQSEEDESSSESGDEEIRRTSLDHPAVKRSITVARQVAGGIHASVAPTLQQGLGMFQRLPIRRFFANARAELNSGSPQD